MSAFSHQFPEAFGALKVQPLAPQSPSPTRSIRTHLGQHLSIRGKQLPFCSAAGAEQVKGVPSAPPPNTPSPSGTWIRMWGGQRAAMVVSVSRITEKRVWVAAKLTAPREERIVRDGDEEREGGSADSL